MGTRRTSASRVTGLPLAAASVLIVVLAAPLAAQHARESEPVESEHAPEAHGEASHANAGHNHKNHLGLFLGVTDEDAETAATIGVDYERRLSKRFGIGLLVESILGDSRELIVGVPIFLHATDRLKLLIAPGFEDVGPFEDDEGHHHDRETVVRIGVEYAFHVGNYSLSPALNVDFVDSEEVLVLGVTIGRGF